MAVRHSRSALVTGGVRGIGLAVAHALRASVHRVAVTHRGDPPATGMMAVACDVNDPEHVDTAFQRVERAHGPVEILVANAGIRRDRLLAQMTPQDFADVIDTDLTGVFHTVRRALPAMLRSGHGRIVLVSSAIALTGGAGQTNYAAAKAGLIGMARSLTRELGPRDITVNVVAPGLVRTSMTEELSKSQRDRLLARTPQRRLVETGEVANAVAFLTSEQAGAITGAVLPVDGGFGMGH
ncbi:3-oxoacyl-ACP reductase FabG [Nocardiopsis sp. NRRL B-16309]|uniref:3-oxoacyl-ACP reductase FabG n=1 Tax=Nocardiopsis sp. NRRL B-16309 TaxID=1519494 RepID=UPI0006AF35C6|nr:3-oxoacyl-ACP reductase FabG [Nocardiopsis sp. NRRL B-16309]KOX11683.1 3-oxoacyl-ACP reductase [Nocardiopsis sp. NRRL B-16309]